MRRLKEAVDIVDEVRSFLNKSGINDDAFLSGARLTDNGYRKMARELGVSRDEIEMLMRSLATRIQDERKHDELILEQYMKAMEDRYSHEVDHVGNVTVRDKKTGDEVRLAGTPAAALRNRLRAGGNHEAILAGVMTKLTEGTDDEDHAEALEQTGFWGRKGAGAIVLALDTGRILLAHRSAFVEQPHTWGGWGGAIDAEEDPKEAAIREVREETGYRGKIIKTVPLYVFKKDRFRYFNFLVVIPSEFEPKLNWESNDASWVEFEKWPKPLHFGLVALFNDPKSISLIKQEVSQGKSLEEASGYLEDNGYYPPFREPGSKDLPSHLQRNTPDQLKKDQEAARKKVQARRQARAKQAISEDDFADEITSSNGTYNFPWKHNGQKGFATARYKGRGPDMTIDVISIRDEDGEPVEASPAIQKAVKMQAVGFIGDE